MVKILVAIFVVAGF